MPPILSKERVFASGDTEIIALVAATGRKAASRPSPGPGTRLAPFPGGLLAATKEGVTVFSEDLSARIVSIPLSGGALGVAHHEGFILAAPGAGGLVLLSMGKLGAGILPKEVARAAGYPSPRFRLYGPKVATVSASEMAKGARGLVSVYGLPGLERLWERTLPFVPAAEPEFNNEGIFVWGEGQLAAFSLEGEARGLVEEVSAPPLLSRNILYYGTADAGFFAATPSTLSVRAKLALPAVLSGRPAVFGDQLLLPLSDGTVLKIDPRRMR